MIRGGIYRVDLGDAKRGHEQRGRRYGLVISDESLVRSWTVTTIVPTSTSAQDALFRPEIDLLGERTLLLIDQIRMVDVQYVQPNPVMFLDRLDMARVERALSDYLGLG